MKILVRKEERKFLLRKLCEYEPQIAMEVQNASSKSSVGSNNAINDTKKTKKKSHSHSNGTHTIKITIPFNNLNNFI